MSTHVIAEYPDEGIALLRDGEGTFIFDRSDSILPVDDEPYISFHLSKDKWRGALAKTRSPGYNLAF